MSAIEIREVSKSFGSVAAVADLSLDVPERSIYGFIGPNGSGKSTTMRMIVGISHPDRGSIRVFGEEMSRPHLRRGILGYTPFSRRHLRPHCETNRNPGDRTCVRFC